MPPINPNNNPLTPRSNQRRRRQHEADAKSRRAQRLISEIKRLQNSQSPQAKIDLLRKGQELTRLTRGHSRQIRAIDTQIRQLASQVERTAKGDDSRSILDKILEGAGNAANVIRSWIRSRGAQTPHDAISSHIQQAIDLIGQFAPELLSDAGKDRVSDPRLIGMSEISEEELRQSQEQRRRELRRAISAPRPESPVPESQRDLPPNVKILPDGRWHIRGPGYSRTMNPDDPKLTGKMIRVQSSNVHSIGFQFNFEQPLKSDLIIRYLQKDQTKSGKSAPKVGGPTYAYHHVHPDFFDDLRDAASKGKWVWDVLRIRGTVAGHQFRYNLTRIAQGYVPRRARVHKGKQYLIRRRRVAQYSDGRQEVVMSSLPTRMIGPYKPSVKRPNVGNRDRGVGRPNR